MEVFTILVPLESNNLLEVLWIKYLQLCRLNTLINQVNTFIDNFSCFIFFLNNMLTQSWQHVHSVSNFKKLGTISNFFIIIFLLEMILKENLTVLLTQIKYRSIIRSHVWVVICVRGWPFIIVKLESKYLTIEQGGHFHTFID